jgi:hypothetical protein
VALGQVSVGVIRVPLSAQFHKCYTTDILRRTEDLRTHMNAMEKFHRKTSIEKNQNLKDNHSVTKNPILTQ